MSSFDAEAFADRLTPISSDQIDALAPDTIGVLISGLDDAALLRLSQRVPHLRYLMTDGNATVTDAGLVALAGLDHLEVLDLEWTPVTDGGQRAIAEHPALQWVDLGGCRVSPEGIAFLRERRPDLIIEAW